MKTIEDETFTNLKSLKLRFPNNKIYSIDQNAFMGLPNLIILELRYPVESKMHLNAFLRAFKKMQLKNACKIAFKKRILKMHFNMHFNMHF